MSTQLAWGASTHVGHSREINEDSFVAVAPVFAVADGMGGHDRGEVASQLVAERFRQLAGAQDLDPDIVVEALHEVHDEIRSRHDRGSGREMGTTVAAAVLLDDPATSRWLIVNVGDSRVYRLVAGDLEQISIDHSVVQELIEAGALTTDGARSHPERNVITRAVGIGVDVVADYALLDTEPGQRILLCSDGVHGQLGDNRIRDALTGHPDPQEAATALVEAVLVGRAPDNLTAVVIDVVSEETHLDEVDDDTSPRPERREHDVADEDDSIGAPDIGDPPQRADALDAEPDDLIQVPTW